MRTDSPAYRAALEAECLAYNRMDDIARDAESTDLELALAIADWHIADAVRPGRDMIRVEICHDVRKRTGTPCPLPYDYRDKNGVGIRTRDARRARDWIARALLLGYAVFRNNFGGSLQNYRRSRTAA
jgi:hypothetical protein